MIFDMETYCKYGSTVYGMYYVKNWKRGDYMNSEVTNDISIYTVIYTLDTTGEKEKRTSKKNVDGRSISSHDNKKFRTRSMEKQRGMAFGFWKTATAVI